MKRFILLILICIFLQQVIIAQDTATFQTRYYTAENGLPSNGLKGMQWDEETGFLWIATEAGIVRFNGIDFKIYSKQNTPFIGSERIRYITRNNQGTIYVVDNNENIIKVRENKLVLHREPGHSKASAFKAFYSLAVSDTFSNYTINYPITGPFPSVFLTGILPASDTSMVFINNEQAFILTLAKDKATRFEPASLLIKEGFKIGNNIFLVSKDNDIFLADIINQKLLPVQFGKPGLFPSGFEKKEFHFFWGPGSVNAIAINNNTAWKLNYDGISITAQEICNVIPNNSLIKSLQYSGEKKLIFIATDSKGLIVISQNRVDAIKKRQASISTKSSYYSQVELPGNNVLTSEGDVIGVSEKADQPLPVIGKLSFNVYAINDTLLWFSKNAAFSRKHCLHCFNFKTGLTTVYDKIPLSDHFAISYSGGNFYIANDEGLGMLQQDSLYFLFRKGSGNFNDFLPDNMLEISPGVLGIAACNKLIRYNITSGVTDTLMTIPGYCIRATWKYKDYLFIGTYGNGYYVYSNGKIKHMPLDKNNFLLYVHCFMPDKYGYCWLSTNRGLFKASITDIINGFENNNTTIYYHYLGRNDGMDITEMNGGCTPCALQMKSGIISFPTMDGLLWVNPEKAMPILPGREIFIDEIQVDNKKINTDSLSIKSLPANTGEILIRVGFSAWCNKENIYLEYQLNDTLNWKSINTAEGAAIRLSNLSPGDYRLRIRKLNGFGTNNYSYKELHFNINTPWYRQWWFYTLAALFAIATGRLYFKLRTRQYLIRQQKLEEQVFEKTRELQYKNEILEKNNTIKTRLISIISHDIVTPLKFLTVAGKNLLQKKELMSEELQEETIRAMTNTSQELQLLSINILNWIKYQNENRLLAKETFNLHELVQQVLGILNSLARQKNLQIVNEVDPDASIYQYYEPMKILVYNMLTNAIHFSEKGTITVRMRTENKQTIVTVKDEGVGMSQEKIQSLMADHVIISSANVDNKKGHGLGFLIIKDLLKTMGASLDIKSKSGEGSAISIIIPSETNNK